MHKDHGEVVLSFVEKLQKGMRRTHEGLHTQKCIVKHRYLQEQMLALICEAQGY